MIAEPLLPLARPVGDLKFLPGNPRRGDVAACKRSLKRFGQRKPIVVRDDGTVEAGNTTLRAALELGWTEIAAVAFGDDDATAKAFALADNRTSELGSFDADALLAMATEVDAVDPELLLAASYDLAELQGKREGKNDPDSTPEPPAEPATQPGDLWLLGPHRLLCGDATVATDVDRLMAGERAVLMMTDPPYGVSYDAEWRGEMGLSPLGANRTGKVAHDDEADWTPVWAIAPADIAYVWHASAFADVVMASLRQAEFNVRQQIIWHKTIPIISRQAYNWQHEPCWYAVRKGANANWQGDHTQTTVWIEPSPNHIMSTSTDDRTDHPTQKPVALYERAIANHTRTGDLLYEPFAGSGSGIIAAHRTRRRCFALDLDPRYCDVICRRFQEHTGGEPVLEATGEPHDFTA